MVLLYTKKSKRVFSMVRSLCKLMLLLLLLNSTYGAYTSFTQVRPVQWDCSVMGTRFIHILWYLLTTMQIAFSSNITFIHVCARYIRYVLPILMQNKPKKFCIEFLKYLMALEITLLNNEDAFLQPSFAYFATLLELPTPWCTNATF